MDNGFGEVGFEDCEIRDVLLIRLDFTEGGDIVDDAIDPNSFNIGNVAAFNLIGNIVVVPLPDLLLSEDFGLELFLVPVW